MPSPFPGMDAYLERQEILNTEAHWVEIDLLRTGTPSVTDPPLPGSDYRILVSRGDERTRFWLVNVRQPLPVLTIPLSGKKASVPLDPGAVLKSVYDRAAHDLSVDCKKASKPPLEGDDGKWAQELLRGRSGK